MSEIERFRTMNPTDVLSHLKANREDAFATIGGRRWVHCGRAAIDRLEKMAERTLHLRSPVDRAFDIRGYVDALGESLVEEYVERGRPVDERSASRMVDRAKRKAAESLVQVTHHIPCEVFSESEPDHFVFGPVEFTTTAKFLNNYDDRIRTYRIEAENDFAGGLRKRSPELGDENIKQEAAAFSTRHVDTIVGYFSDHDWVASVTIPPCHFAVSQQRAERAIDAALDALRLFALYAPERLRRSGSSREPRETHHLYSRRDGKLDAVAFYSGRGATAGDGWYSHHTTEAVHLWRPLQEAVGPICSDEPMDELNRRLVDALDWFGQAVQEAESAAAVVKYTAALERLTMTGYVSQGIEKLVIERVLMLNQDRADKTPQEITNDLGRLYECRSNLMHGSISPWDPKIADVLRTGWEVTRWSIFEAAQLFTLIRKHGTPNRKGLAAVYEGGRRTLSRTDGV